MALISCPECKKKISDTSDRCPTCGFQLSPEIIADIKKKDQKVQRGMKKGCIGCLGVIGVIMLIGFIGSLIEDRTGPRGVNIEGDTALKMILFSSGNLDFAATKTAEVVYKIAKKYDKINKIVLSLYISSSMGGGLIDKYGNRIKGDQHMGRIIIEDLNEVRKYRSAFNYSGDPLKKGYFKFRISQMEHAYLLK